MIKFHCKNCGQRFHISEKHAGKKGQCPKCKSIVVIPKTHSSGTTKKQVDSWNDSLLLDLAPKENSQDQTVGQDSASEYVITTILTVAQGPSANETKEGEIGKRRFPWFIDVFLYPTSGQGLTILALMFLVPILFSIVGEFFTVPCVGLILGFIFGIYLCWYFGECIRDSTVGGIRAPDAFTSSATINDMFYQVLDMILCVFVFLGPVFFYFFFTHRKDRLFWFLLSYGIFFFPMGLLAVIVLDSLSALNPFLIIVWIFRTFLPYCGLIFLFCGIYFVIRWLGKVIEPGVGDLGDLMRLVFYNYFIFVGAHLLGRFFFTYKDRLNW